MGVEENRSLERRFYEEVWNRGHVEVAAEVFADDGVRHDLRPTQAGAEIFAGAAPAEETSTGDG